MTAKAMAASTPSGAFDALADRVTLAAFHPPYERPVPGSLVANAMVNRSEEMAPAVRARLSAIASGCIEAGSQCLGGVQPAISPLFPVVMSNCLSSGESSNLPLTDFRAWSHQQEGGHP